MHVATLPIEQIAIRGRARREMRNIDSLAKSIRDRGLLQPIVVRPDGDGYALVAGGRRIEALRSLGRLEVPAHVAESLSDELEALLAEGEENTERESFTPTEAVEHAERIRSVEEQRAIERRRAAAREAGTKAAPGRPVPKDTAPVLEFIQPPEKGVGNLPTPFTAGAAKPSGRVRDQVAKATGMSGRTLEKARHVVQAAQDPEAPEPVRQAAREAQRAMDRTGKVDPAFKRVREAEVEALVAPVRNQFEASGVARDVEREKWQAAFQKELAKAFGLIGMFRPDQVANGADDAQMKELHDLAASLASYVERIEALRERPAGLSLVSGG